MKRTMKVSGIIFLARSKKLNMETPQNSKANNTDPVDKKEEVQKSKDKHIDQDFEGYPHHPAKENVIHPKTENDLNIAGSGDVEEFAQVKPEEKKDTGD